MSEEPYLILHKVRGLPAFDIAIRMRCPICDSSDRERRAENMSSCHECDGLGYWWIIPTSGHRAYPAWACELSGLHLGWSREGVRPPAASEVQPQVDWNNYPDHYAHNDRKGKTATQSTILDSVIAALTKPKEPMKRRV